LYSETRRATVKSGLRTKNFRAWLVAAVMAVTVPLVGHSVASAAGEERLLAYGARIVGDDARTRIVIDFDRPPSFSIHYIANPERVVVDLPATAFGFPAKDLEARGLFKDIRYGTMDGDSARIVLTATKPVRIGMAKVQVDENGKGQRLVLEAEMTDKATFSELVKAQSWSEP
jgi:N-acetylmuramoyl-L-alanine amidase